MAQLNDRFILLPSYIDLGKKGLHYKDLLTYVSIRSFYNSKTGTCKPSYDTIARVSGMTKKFLTESIKRLEQSGYLTVRRSQKKRTSNQYSFKEVDSFNRIPYGILEADDLTSYQKAMLLALRQCVESLTLQFMHSDINTLSALLQLSYKTVYTQYNALVGKGYISKVDKTYKHGFSRTTAFLSDKINWQYDNSHVKLLPPVVEKLDVSTHLIVG